VTNGQTAAALSPTARWFWVIALAMAWFGALEYRALVNPDEGRYGEIAREMVVTGDWVTPRLNGLKYFEKPPLQYWATAAAISVFGEQAWVARLWTAFAGFAGILFTGFAVTRLYSSFAGVVASAVLASSLLWNLMGHFNALDMGVSFFLSAAVFMLCLAESNETSSAKSRRWRDGAWASLGLAILSKGLIGLVLPAATVALYVLWQRDWHFLARLQILRGLLIILAITAPWFVAVSLANPEFPQFFFIHEHFERFLTKVHRRVGPPWYFVPILIVGMVPWLFSLPQAIATGFWRDTHSRFAPNRFLLCWIIVVFGFFSASSSKLPSYIVPILPAIAALIGAYLSHAAHSTHLYSSLRSQAILVTVAGAAALAAMPLVNTITAKNVSAPFMVNYLPWIYTALLMLVIGGVASFWLAQRRRFLPSVLTLSLAGHLFGMLIILGHDSLAVSGSGRDLVRQLEAKQVTIPADEPMFSVESYDQSLPYYLKRTMTLVAYQDELAFGIRQEPQKYIESTSEFVKIWAQQKNAWAFMTPHTFDILSQQGVKMQEVVKDHRRVIVRSP
jgi:4-amino-4-deoxy-L-arabinose transferase-like glycosyltransferase